ncbi:Smr/MutS family protein [Pusillimonas sp.]|uniref:Smr/MutS family protein n=1 Tax=Pusillimonas sp. TaxID=3040095 RepID=UPI0037C8A202
MQTSNKRKPGLADLKQLRQQAEAASTPAPAPPKRKRRNFAASGKTAVPEAKEPGTNNPAGKAALPVAASPLTAEDKALFRRAVESVQPLAPPNRVILPPVPRAPRSILKQKRLAATGLEVVVPAAVSDHYAPARLAADASHFAQAGHGPDLVKKLAQGKWPIGASLDLHGSTLEEARLRMDGFLRSCLQHSIRCVRIVHGKGHGSKNNAPVLKETVRRWLTQLEDVMAYTECAERDGGAGAVLVLLRADEDQGSEPQR